jgi:hypothetical protein
VINVRNSIGALYDKENSNKSLTKLQNARVSKRGSRELKHFKINLARQDALATILLMCRVNDKLASYETPSSVQFDISGGRTDRYDSTVHKKMCD